MIHFELVSVYGARYGQGVIAGFFAQKYSNFLAPVIALHPVSHETLVP